MQSILFVLSAVIAMTSAHMSMQFPLARNSDANGNVYEVWKSNEPMLPVRPHVCHGLPSKDVPAENTFAVGEVITLNIYGTASHFGGHCTFWYSTDDIEFTKIADVKDCTLNSTSTQVQIPSTLPTQCGDKCTFAWSWVPTESGTCEVYSNCADIKVTGLTSETEDNPITFNFQDIVADQTCQRVNPDTHWTDMFLPIKVQDEFGPQPAPSNPPVDVPSPPPSNPPVPSVNPDSENLIVTNLGTLSQWWFRFKVDNVAEGYALTSAAVISNNVLSACTLNMDSGYPTFGCPPSTGTSFQLPLTVRVSSLVDDEELMVEGTNVVTSYADGAQFDLGGNFDDNVVPPTPSTSSSTSSTATSTSTSSTSTTSASSTSTTSISSTSTWTSTSSPSSTLKPAPSGESIKVKNEGIVNHWWYAGAVSGVNAGYFIEYFQIRGDGGQYFLCHLGNYGEGKVVYTCSAPKHLVYPLSVKITGSDGQSYESVDSIVDMQTGSVFDLGINIGNGPVVDPTPPPVTSTTSSTSTTDTSSTSSTTGTSSTSSTTSSTTAPSTTSPSTTSSTTSPSTTSSTTAPSTTSSTTSSSTSSSTTSSSSTSSTTSSASTTNQPNPDDVADKEIIAYYASWQWYDRNKLAKPSNLDFSKVTIVNFAFFQPDTEGNLYGTDDWADPQVLFGSTNWNPPENSSNAADYRCHRGLEYPKTGQKKCGHYNLEEGLIHLVHEEGARIFPSIGGWTLSDNFPGIAADAAKRKHFAEQCVGLIEDYGFDGIDLDWEYPAYADHSGTAADTENFVLLLQELRSALDTYGATTDKYYEITAAVGCGPSTIAGYDIPQTAPLLDQINLMTYDFFGGWSDVTGANAPLYYQGFPSGFQEWSVDGCVANWMEGGAVKSQLNIGLPFYGQSFVDANGPNQPHKGTDKAHWPEDKGKPQYFNIEARLEEMTVIRDPVSQTQQAWFKDGTGYLSFDDQQAICNKVEYVLDEQLNGFIIWEISGDVREDLSTPLLDEVNMKLDYPNTHVCASATN